MASALNFVYTPRTNNPIRHGALLIPLVNALVLWRDRKLLINKSNDGNFCWLSTTFNVINFALSIIIDEIKRENTVRATEWIAMLPYSALIFLGASARLDKK